jgi:hypothetical protein
MTIINMKESGVRLRATYGRGKNGHSVPAHCLLLLRLNTFCFAFWPHLSNLGSKIIGLRSSTHCKLRAGTLAWTTAARGQRTVRGVDPVGDVAIEEAGAR